MRIALDQIFPRLNPLELLLAGAFWLFCVVQVCLAIRSGKVLGRYGIAERREDPINFWVFFVLYGVLSVLLPAGALIPFLD